MEHMSFGHLLSKASRLAKADITRRMSTLGLTFPQWMVLKDISNYENSDPSHLTMAAIARRLNSNRPNIMGMTDRLEKLNLVTKVVNPDDRRAHIITLTPKAKDVMDQLQDMGLVTTEKALKGFTLREIELFHDYLERIVTNLLSEEQIYQEEGTL